MRDLVREKDYRLRITRNRTSSVFQPNNEYWKRSHSKSMKGALPGGDRILACVNGRENEVAHSELREIAWLAYLGIITSIGSGRALKL